MSRSVVALDATVGAVSVARIVEGEPLPKCGLVRSDEIHGARTPAQNSRRQSDHAHRVVEAITASGSPTLVVMCKLVWSDLNRDPSAGRRAGVWWSLVEQLTARDIPVAEVSILTAEKTVVGRSAFGAKGYNALAAEIQRMYPNLAVPSAPYRPTTVGVGLCGAMCAGIETRLSVTDERLASLAAGDWPSKFKPAQSAAEWTERYREVAMQGLSLSCAGLRA